VSIFYTIQNNSANLDFFHYSKA